MEFNTGERFCYSAEYLRVESPADEGVRDAAGRLKVRQGGGGAADGCAAAVCLPTHAPLPRRNPYFPTRHTSGMQVVQGRRHVGSLDVQPVGSYAVR